ncbi:MAG: glutamine synthetase family protein [Marinobacterium sp.]|nr:glutamine synthetase family protein [Marinobacterium sp.]
MDSRSTDSSQTQHKPQHNADEARQFLADNPDIQSIDLMLPDMNGVLRGKRITPDALTKVYQDGVALPASMFALDVTGHTIEETGLGFALGEPDRICKPVPGTLVRVAWGDQPRAQVLMSMYQFDGKPMDCDPRHVLSKVLDRFTAMGLTPMIAVETEFYAFDKQRDERGTPQPPISPATGQRDGSTQVYAISELDDYADYIAAIKSAATVQNLPVDTAIAECAPGQFEINLKHRPDALAACDDAVQLKRLIKGVSAGFNMDTSFMAKPYEAESGSGTHIHISLLDNDGHNVFRAEDDGAYGSLMLQQAVAGLLDLLPESMALFAPNANSFRRFQPGSYVPMNRSWGVDNRTVAVRIPAGNPVARRLEHRVSGADANPYLLVAALLASIWHGINRQLQPPAPVVEGDACAEHPPCLPDGWGEALHCFADSQWLPEYLGADFCRIYYANRNGERLRFNQHISRLEYDWYLRQV